MASQAHKDNILSSTYRDVGYAAVNGVLLGSETTLVVAMYGSKATAPIPAVTTPTPTVQSTKVAPTTVPSTVSPQTTAKKSTAEPAVTTPTATNKAAKPTADHPSSDQTAPVQESTVLSNASGVVEGASVILQPIKAYQSFNWGQKASIVLICTMLLLYIMKHTLIWRAQKRGVRHIWLRAHPIGQTSLLVVMLVLTISSSVGSIL
jgi:hypothetical protein